MFTFVYFFGECQSSQINTTIRHTFFLVCFNPLVVVRVYRFTTGWAAGLPLAFHTIGCDLCWIVFAPHCNPIWNIQAFTLCTRCERTKTLCGIRTCKHSRTHTHTLNPIECDGRNVPVPRRISAFNRQSRRTIPLGTHARNYSTTRTIGCPYNIEDNERAENRRLHTRRDSTHARTHGTENTRVRQRYETD